MKPILKDKEEFPTIENLANHLSEKDLLLYQQLLESIHEYSFQEDWNYYNDGHNWLSKILFKKEKPRLDLHLGNRCKGDRLFW